MAQIQASGVSLAYGDRDILDNVSIKLSSGDRCALAGANGSGKSTLMRILANHISPDAGSIALSADARVVYLPQSGVSHKGRTLMQEVELAYGEIDDLIREQDAIAAKMQATGDTSVDHDTLAHEYQAIQERIEASGYYERSAQIDRILRGLGFTDGDPDRQTDEFSGGWQMRIALAKVLLQHPDFMLLDEPTNYLDVEARVWLGSFLSSYSGGVLMVSHDRRFLDESINTVWELFLADVRRYRGSYSEYERQREAEIEQIKADYARQQDEIQKIEDFIRRFRATASKAKQVQSRVKQLEKIQRIEIPEHLKHVRISFPAAPRSGREVVTIGGVSRAYGANQVLQDVELVIERGQRVVLVGPNGAGKSTLLRILAGQDSHYGGDLVRGAEVSLGYYADDDSWMSQSLLSPADETGPTVLDATLNHAHGQTEQRIRDLLGAFLFRGDDIYKSVHVLSGGERSRLSMLQLLLQPHNLLVLDEPTNHLDLASKEVLSGALDQFGGTIIFVSHDREFIEGLASRVIELKPNEHEPLSPSDVHDFTGDYHYYAWRLEHRGDEIEHRPTRGVQATSPSASTRVAAPQLSHEEQKRRRSRQAKLEREVESLMARLESLEADLQRVQTELADPDVYSDAQRAKEATARMKKHEQEIARVTEQWEHAAAELEEFLGDGLE